MIKVRDRNIKTRVFNNFKGFLQQKLCKSTFTFYLLVSQRKGLSNTPFADLTASVMPPLSNPFSIDPHHTKPREYGDFFHRILPYSRSLYTINMGQLFKKYTETVFNRILSEYRKIPCQKAPYSQWFRVVHYTKFSSIHCIRTP